MNINYDLIERVCGTKVSEKPSPPFCLKDTKFKPCSIQTKQPILSDKEYEEANQKTIYYNFVLVFYYNLNYIRPKVQKRTGKIYEKTLKCCLVSAIKALYALEGEEVSNFSKEQ